MDSKKSRLVSMGSHGLLMVKYTVFFQYVQLDKIHVNGKRQIQVKNFSEQKIGR